MSHLPALPYFFVHLPSHIDQDPHLPISGKRPWYVDAIVHPTQMQVINKLVLYNMRPYMDAWKKEQHTAALQFLVNAPSYKHAMVLSIKMPMRGLRYSSDEDTYLGFFSKVFNKSSGTPSVEQLAFWSAFYPSLATQEIRLSSPLPLSARLYTAVNHSCRHLPDYFWRAKVGGRFTVGAPMATTWHPNVALHYADQGLVILDYDVSSVDPASLPKHFGTSVQAIMAYELDTTSVFSGDEFGILLQPGVIIELQSIYTCVMSRTCLHRVSTLANVRMGRTLPDGSIENGEEYKVYHCKIVGACNNNDLLKNN